MSSISSNTFVVQTTSETNHQIAKANADILHSRKLMTYTINNTPRVSLYAAVCLQGQTAKAINFKNQIIATHQLKIEDLNSQINMLKVLPGRIVTELTTTPVIKDFPPGLDRMMFEYLGV